MDCKKARELISPYIDNALSERDAASLKAHLDTCDDCRADYELTKKTVAALHDSVVAEPPEFAQSLHERLMREAAATPAPRRSAWYSRRPYWSVCAAAVLVLIVRSAYFDVYLPQTKHLTEDISITETMPVTGGQAEMEQEQAGDTVQTSMSNTVADTSTQPEGKTDTTPAQNKKVSTVQPAPVPITEPDTVQEIAPADMAEKAPAEQSAPFVRMVPETAEKKADPTPDTAPAEESVALAAEPAGLPMADTTVAEDSAEPIEPAAFSGGGGGGAVSGGATSGATAATITPADAFVRALAEQTGCPVTRAGNTVTVQAGEDCDTLLEWLSSRPEVAAVQVTDGVITVTLK